MALLPPRKPLAIMRSVVFAMVLRELHLRFSSERIGAFWILAEPIIHFTIYMIILSTIRRRVVPGMELPVYILFGLIPFFLFRNIWTDMMNALEANRALFSYRQVQLIDAWVARLFFNFCVSVCVLLLVGIVLGLWGDYDVLPHLPLQWIATLAIGLALAFGSGMIFCVWAETMPEVKMFIRSLNLPLYLVSGVIIPVQPLPSSVIDWLALNPWLHVMEFLHWCLTPTYQIIPQANLIYPAAWAMVTLFVGFGLYRARRYQMLAA